MLVEKIMNRNVITLTTDNTISEAIKIMSDNKVRHLPVIDEDNELIGLVTDRDIREAKPSIFQFKDFEEDLNNSIETIMNRTVIAGHPLDFVSEIAAVFYEFDIGCLPIIQDSQLVGIITETDLLHTLVQLTGSHQPGSQIEIRVSNKVQTLCNISTIIAKHSTNISSILFYPDEDNNSKILVLRIPTMNPTKLVKDLIKSGYDVLWPKMPGITI